MCIVCIINLWTVMRLLQGSKETGGLGQRKSESLCVTQLLSIKTLKVITV